MQDDNQRFFGMRPCFAAECAKYYRGVRFWLAASDLPHLSPFQRKFRRTVLQQRWTSCSGTTRLAQPSFDYFRLHEIFAKPSTIKLAVYFPTTSCDPSCVDIEMSGYARRVMIRTRPRRCPASMTRHRRRINNLVHAQSRLCPAHITLTTRRRDAAIDRGKGSRRAYNGL